MSRLDLARVAFAGTPAFAVPTLSMLVEEGADIAVVLTQPDRPAGRGRGLTVSPVKSLAVEHRLELAQPARLDEPALLGGFGSPPDVMLVVAYGLMLPPWLLDWPRVGCVNVHASLLPRWRGAAPIQRALLAGDEVTGISLIRMDSGLDTGPVYSRHRTAIGPGETAASLHERLSRLGAEAARAMLPGIIGGEVEPRPQQARDATYAPKLTKREAQLDWQLPAVELERRVRAFNPWPVAEGTLTNGQRLRIWAAAVVDEPARAPAGSVLKTGRAGIEIATGQGRLLIRSVQPPGGRIMDAAAYLASHNVDGLAFESPAP